MAALSGEHGSRLVASAPPTHGSPDHTARPETRRGVGEGPHTAPDLHRKGGWKEPALTVVKPRRPGRRLPWAAVLAGALVPVLLAGVGLAVKLWGTTPPGPGTEPGPADTNVFLPPRCVKGDGAKVVPIEGNRACYDKVAYRVDDGTLVPFLLVPKDWGSDPRGLEVPSFYIMEDKVSVGLFKKFAAKRRQLLNPEWENGARLTGGKNLGTENERLPVLGVKVTDAHRFAEWLGGRLPSVEQWNKAAGAYAPEAGKGPFLGVAWHAPANNDEMALDRATVGPMPVGSATRDVTATGCRDMAGNGQELTRNLADSDSNETVPLQRKPQSYDRVVVRGHSFATDHPPLFEDLTRADLWMSVRYESPDRDTGFRVVIELAP
jgi:formylglycine-generating enzyme required for sulfatase activity